MKRWFALAAIAIFALTMACGGGSEEPAAKAPAAAAKTPPAAAPVAKAPAPAAKAPAAAPAAEAPAPAVAAAPEDSVKQCLALAAQMKWSEALDPCTQAAKDHPADLRIKHAVQQAQAAAEG